MNTSITLLGTSNSGKTNFISETIKDINSFSPKISMTPVISEQTADIEHFCNNQYVLSISESIRWNISICDYDGKLLRLHGNERSRLKEVLYSSDIWIILIDGIYFAGGEGADERSIREIKRSSARVLCPYISEYAEEHDETAPELLFVVTKADGLIDKFVPDRIKYIIMKAFEGIFEEGYSPMILLCETSCTKTAGTAVLSLCYIKRRKEVSDGIRRLEERDQKINSDINRLHNMIYETEDHKILGRLPANKRKVENFKGQIYSLERERSNNDNRIGQYRKDEGLKYLGTCVQCWIDNNPQLVIDGSDKIDHPYDRSSIKIVKKGIWVKIALGFDVCLFGLMYVLSRSEMLSEGDAGLCGIVFTVWAILSVILAIVLDKQRKKFFYLKFKDDLVNFFYVAAKEKK